MPMPFAAALQTPTPLSTDKVDLLAHLTDGLDAAGLWWLSGYAAGLAERPVSALAAPVAETHASAVLTIVYGSQTGNAKRLADRLAQLAEANGIGVRLLRADAYPLRELRNERHLYLVISTQGDGDPPDDARGFVAHVLGKRAPKLPLLNFAVLGLGDSSYPQFCAIGRQLDARLAELGATRVIERGDADLDLETIADPWLAQALDNAKRELKSQQRGSVVPLRPALAQPVLPTWSREHPFAAELLVNQRITTRDSTRDIRHLEISLEGSGLHYEPGDALGVWPRNPAQLVEAVLDALALDGGHVVDHAGQSLPLRTWLTEHRELTRLARPFLASHAAHARSDDLNRLLAPDRSNEFARMLATHQVIDVLQDFPAAWSAEELVAALRPLAPRLYSIASSSKVVGDEAHLTVAHVEYAAAGSARWGAASHFLAASADSERLPIYIERNERFRIPHDSMRDIVMIGPGTGVAPFRGFVQEREAVGASGRNWLLFGNPHSRSDFLYQLEWQDALKRGALHRLDLAFSRDDSRKIYVQDRLREHGRELYAWLDNGAHLYVCGATAMGKGVHAALIDAIAEHGGKSAEDAEDFLDTLQQQGRYARDVY
jgi:sulfite reductase (NADPH) flavoprotein alpha-component